MGNHEANPEFRERAVRAPKGFGRSEVWLTDLEELKVSGKEGYGPWH